MWINNGRESDSMKKNWKNKVIQKWWIYDKGKSMIKWIGFNEPSSGIINSETGVDRTLKHPSLLGH